MKVQTIYIIRGILIIIIAFISCTIFGFSSQNAEKSSSISGKVAKIIIKMQPKYKNITEEKMEELISVYQKPVRKLAHFSIYTLLGISIVGLTCTYKLTTVSKATITIISGMIYAISDEIHQTFIEGRSGQITDVLIDTAGIILGVIIVLLILKLMNNLNVKIN